MSFPGYLEERCNRNAELKTEMDLYKSEIAQLKNQQAMLIAEIYQLKKTSYISQESERENISIVDESSKICNETVNTCIYIYFNLIS